MVSKASFVTIAAAIASISSDAQCQAVPQGVGFKAEFLAELSVSEKHLVGLAEAIPDDLYTWRPAPGVRSFSEVLLHVAASNFNTPRVLGVAPQEGMLGADYDRSYTQKAVVVAALKESFAFLRSGIGLLEDEDADRMLPWFGGENTFRGALYFMARHTGEHTGQLIAYARVNGIVPPWSQGSDGRF